MVNTAIASGRYGTTTVSDDDVAGYAGSLVTQSLPSIQLKKTIWDGTAWQDADTTAAAVTLPQGTTPRYRFEITNAGDVQLTSVMLTDEKLSINAGACPGWAALGWGMQRCASAEAGVGVAGQGCPA